MMSAKSLPSRERLERIAHGEDCYQKGDVEDMARVLLEVMDGEPTPIITDKAENITDSGEMITDKPPTPDWIMLAAVTYQAAGAYNMPARIMDMLAAAQNGEDFGNPLLLLPIEYPEQEDQE